jgi:hypothetical protein
VKSPTTWPSGLYEPVAVSDAVGPTVASTTTPTASNINLFEKRMAQPPYDPSARHCRPDHAPTRSRIAQGETSVPRPTQPRRSRPRSSRGGPKLATAAPNAPGLGVDRGGSAECRPGPEACSTPASDSFEVTNERTIWTTHCAIETSSSGDLPDAFLNAPPMLDQLGKRIVETEDVWMDSGPKTR